MVQARQVVLRYPVDGAGEIEVVLRYPVDEAGIPSS